MNRLKQKLKNQNGASMLLALLFFLLCSMIGSSILVAAVSNAGKLNSNEEQHRIYLALSSAVRLVCDDVTNSEYRGVYDYNEETDENSGNTNKTFNQKDGKYQRIGSDKPGGTLGNVLRKELDIVLREELTNGIKNSVNNFDSVISDAESLGGLSEKEFYVKPNTGTYLDDMGIKVKIKVDKQYKISVTAVYTDTGEDETTTADDVSYSVSAELTPIKSAIKIGTPQIGENKETNPMQWELGLITTE